MSIDFFSEFLFEIFTFAFLLVSSYWIYKNFLKNSLICQYEREREFSRELENKNEMINAGILRAKIEERKQKELFSKLSKKVEMWVEVIKRDAKQKEAEKLSIASAILKKREIQRRNMRTIKMNKLITAKAVEEVRKSISKQVSGKTGAKLLDELVHKIGKVPEKSGG